LVFFSPARNLSGTKYPIAEPVYARVPASLNKSPYFGSTTARFILIGLARKPELLA